MNTNTMNPPSVGDFLVLDGGCGFGTLLGKDDGFKDKVEFVGDCEPSTFVGGWVKLNS